MSTAEENRLLRMPRCFHSSTTFRRNALELNLQASFIVGMVGAGGIGFQLQQDATLFQWLEVGLLVVLLMLMVNMVDYLSYQIRRVFA